MSNVEAPKEGAMVPKWAQAIQRSEDKFRELSKIHNAVNWTAEANYARQILQKNDYALKVAQNNPMSLMDAMTNVGAIGLSLNPAEALAYLVPRDGAIVLDISYRGMIRLATDTRSVQWAKAEIVRKTDNFTYRGPAREPLHEIANPFSTAARGEMIGVYCIAKTIGGDILCEIMSIEEIHKTRDTSMSYVKNSNNSPWTHWPEEMTKKTIIKRASKTWPRSKQTRRYDAAVAVLNSHEGIDTSEPEERVGEAVRLYRAHDKNEEWTPDEMVAIKDVFMRDIPNRMHLEGANNHEKGKIRRIVQNAIMEAPNTGSQIEVIASSLLVAYHEERDTEVAEIMNELTNEDLHAFWPMMDRETDKDLRGIQFKHQENAA